MQLTLLRLAGTNLIRKQSKLYERPELLMAGYFTKTTAKYGSNNLMSGADTERGGGGGGNALLANVKCRIIHGSIRRFLVTSV